MARTGLFATALFTFVFVWNDFLFALVLTRTEVVTYTVQVTHYFGGQSNFWAKIAAMSVLGTLPPDTFAGRETLAITFGGGAFQQTLPADRYVLQFALPNFFFHVTTAYDILRHRGVPVGKRDYLGPFDGASA